MHLLLDTHILLWSVKSDRRLNAAARAIIIGASEVYVSSVSIWEVAIKVANRRLNIDIDALIAEISKNGFTRLE